MAECLKCGKKDPLISSFLGLCRDCILNDFQGVESHIHTIHRISREAFNLPSFPPQEKGGISCNYCFNQCTMKKGTRGYCGIRSNKDGKKISPPPKQGFLSWYYDSLPTNCVGDWVCPGGTGAGFPQYTYFTGPEYGYKSLAVFYHGCTFNCLFCQNWFYREELSAGRAQSSFELAQAVDEKTSCICYFGGDPTPQLLHSIHTSRLAMSHRKKILRFCWETNGTMNSRFLEEILDIAAKSGGCIKFDLKAFHSGLNTALCGRSNQRTKANFELAAEWIKKRPEPPLVIASTLLVPGYVEREEVYQIARFIASFNPEIPYSLLGFFPHFYFRDLPPTSRNHAKECREAALEAGIKRIRIGNIHLLGNHY